MRKTGRNGAALNRPVARPGYDHGDTQATFVRGKFVTTQRRCRCTGKSCTLCGQRTRASLLGDALIIEKIGVPARKCAHVHGVSRFRAIVRQKHENGVFIFTDGLQMRN